MQGKDFLYHVWSLQGEGWATLAYRTNDKEWLEFHFRFPQDWDKVADLPDDGDLYFCPNLFMRKCRIKEQCLPSRIMYQDLDYVHPVECPVLPTLWWETSPDRYQAIWVMESHVETKDFASLNKALNRACGADPGTWNLTRLLRVPGSFNLKRGCIVGEALEGELLVEPEAA